MINKINATKSVSVFLLIAVIILLLVLLPTTASANTLDSDVSITIVSGNHGSGDDGSSQIDKPPGFKGTDNLVAGEGDIITKEPVKVLVDPKVPSKLPATGSINTFVFMLLAVSALFFVLHINIKQKNKA